MAKTCEKESQQEELLERIRFLVEKFSQSEVARRTGNRASNVHHYLQGRKIPADFCMSLIEEFKVNPRWLLTGKGEAHQFDANLELSSMAQNLLELVKAMNSLVKMKIQSLGKEQYFEALSQYKNLFRDYQRLCENLNKQTSPLFNQLLGEFYKAVVDGEFEVADAKELACAQLEKLSADEELKLNYLSIKGYYQHEKNNHGKALELMRQVFFRSLPDTASDGRIFQTTANFVIMLFQARRLKEARRICAAILAFAEGNQDFSVYYNVLAFYYGMLQTELGDIRQGGVYTRKSQASFENETKDYHWISVMRLQLFGAEAPLSALPDIYLGNARAAVLLISFALWREDYALLRRSHTRYKALERDASKPENPLTVIRAEVLLQVYRTQENGDDLSSLTEKEFVAELPQARFPFQVTEFNHKFSITQILRIAGNKELALKRLQETDKIYTSLPEELTPDLLYVATHYRNALELIPEQTRTQKLKTLRKRAQEFFQTHYDNGFGCFREYAKTDSEATKV